MRRWLAIIPAILLLGYNAATAQTECQPLDATFRTLPPKAKYTLYSGIALAKARYAFYEFTGVLPPADRLLIIDHEGGQSELAFVHNYAICIRLALTPEQRRVVQRDMLGEIV